MYVFYSPLLKKQIARIVRSSETLFAQVLVCGRCRKMIVRMIVREMLGRSA
jgi:hypothetical protein